MSKEVIFQVEAYTQEEVWDKIYSNGLFEDIEKKMLENDVRELTIEYGIWRLFNHNGLEDYDFDLKGEFEICDTELDIDWYTVSHNLYQELKENK